MIALFPEIPSDRWGHHCLSYCHIGQHGGADPDLSLYTRPSTPDEAKALSRELEAIGYDLKPVKRVSRKMDETRRRLIA